MKEEFTYNLLQKIKSVFRKFGLEISFYDPSRVFIKQFINALESNKIDLIIDVGANKGQFALETINAGYKGNIISIEPLSDAYQKLLARSKKYKNWIIFPRMAIGNKNSYALLNVSQNSVSSSILALGQKHLDCAPSSAYVRKEKVKIYKLDNFINKFKKYKNILLKIDTQGYESYVLEGSKKLLSTKKIKGVFLEVSFEEVYKNQKTFDYIYNKLRKQKFKIWGMENVLIEKKSGQIYQANLLLIR